MKIVLSTVAVMALAGIASAQALTLAGPGPQTFANGAGSGFGGTLGAGSITMSVVGSDLVISFAAGGSVNDYVALYLDTRSGGFSDSQMDDQGDDGRRVISNLTRDLVDNFPISPDFGVAFWNGGQTVAFELNAGNTSGHLNYVNNSYNASGNSLSIPLAVLGNPTQIDWFAAYCSGSGYNSNESMGPSPSLQANGNVGFGDGQFGGTTPASGQVDYTSFNRYVIPTPGAAALMGLGALAAGRRRR